MRKRFYGLQKTGIRGACPHPLCTPHNCNTASFWQTSYNYDLAGDISSWTHPGQFTLTHTISAAQRITQVSSSLSDTTHPSIIAQGISYTPWGALSTLTNGCVGTGCTNIQETYDYNQRLQPVRFQLGTSSNSAANYCLVYNYYLGVSNPTSCAVPSTGSTGNNGSVMGYLFQDTTNPSLGHTATYTYDMLKRLTTAVATGNTTYNLTFSNDRYDNMTCVINGQTNGPCVNSLTFDISTNRISTSGYTYDAAGDLTLDPTTTPSASTYSWDAEGRMAQVVQGGTTYSTETYNAFGQRVETYYPGSGAKTDGVFDPAGNELGYYDAVGNAWYDRDIWLEDRMIAQAYPSDTYFLHANALSSDTQLTSHTGSVLMDLLYYPLGQRWTTAGTLLDAHFAGFQQSGGNYNTTPTRAYANTHGHWLTPDLLGGDITNPQTLNRYEYVMDSPTSFADPSGLGGPCGNAGQPPCGSQEPCDAGLWMPICTPGFGFEGLGNWDEFATLQMLINYTNWVATGDTYTYPSFYPIPDASGPASLPFNPLSSETIAALVPPIACPAVPFTVTGIGPKQATDTTAITQTPRASIPNGGVAIKPGNFGVGGVNRGNRAVLASILLFANWSAASVPAGLPSQGPYSPVDVIAPASVRNSPGNMIDVYNYTSTTQSWASTRTVPVIAIIPNNTVGVKCPK